MATRKQLFLNFKGGTGKTSLSSNYAYRLAEMGHRVLVIDLDSQGHATKCLGFEGEDFPKTLLEVLVKRVPMKDVIQKTDIENLSFVPSNLTMSTVDLALMPMAGREFKLKNALKEVEAHYDFIIFDAPPSFGLLNLNALIATDDLIVPVLADFLSFHGLKLLFETVQSLEEDLSHVLDHVFIVVNSFNQTFKLAKEALEALKKHYPEYLMPQVIRQCTKFAQASSEGLPIFRFDRDFFRRNFFRFSNRFLGRRNGFFDGSLDLSIFGLRFRFTLSLGFRLGFAAFGGYGDRDRERHFAVEFDVDGVFAGFLDGVF